MTSENSRPYQPAIEISDLTVAYDEAPVLWDIDLEIPSGVIAGVIGPNGAGKSTLIKAILGIVTPAAGTISVLGRSYRKARRRVGYIPQRTSVDWDFPTTVFDVVLMGSYGRLGWVRRPRRRDREEAMEALEVVGMQQYANRQIGELSGGQQQRTFVARALLQRSDVYLMDEPLQGVDALTEQAIVGILRELKQQGKTLLVVHHDLQTAEQYFDWITLLNVRTVASGRVQEVFTDENLKATYGGRLNLGAATT
ncbi:MAG: metal ABC transporter ATP-binding protein [Spirochaetales bacterium]